MLDDVRCTSVDPALATDGIDVYLDGHSLTLHDVRMLLQGAHASISESINTEEFFNRSVQVFCDRLADGNAIYGVNTLFGGLANHKADCPHELQERLITSHICGTGQALPTDVVKLTMYLRANSMCHGVSGIRKQLVDRYIQLANHDCTPLVHSIGSIGASGDLVPLSEIASAITGASEHSEMRFEGTFFPAREVLKKLGLKQISLNPKEGLAMINGTSCLTAIAAQNALDLCELFSLHVQISIAMCEILEVDMRPFHPTIHNHRPHPGQKWIASLFRGLLKDSRLVRSQNSVEQDFKQNELVQDRYSTRCIPQFLGPIVEDMMACIRTIEIEMNSATDNPLVDHESASFLHGGNFLGQHIAMAMDRMRVNIALLAKHNEAHVSQLVEPTFSRGLSSSLTAPGQQGRCVGVKPIQILSNSIAPLLEQKAAPLCVHFPIYAEQFNQNLNSQGFGSAMLTRESIDLLRQHSAATLLIMMQAAQCRAAQKDTDIATVFGRHTCELLAWSANEIGMKDSHSFVCSPEHHGQYSQWIGQLNDAIKRKRLPVSMRVFDESTNIN